LAEAEANRLITSLEKEVRLGYFDPCVIDWRDELRECRELSAQFGCRMVMRSGDVVQVAVARLSGADLFVTCDEDQHGLASTAGFESCYVH
jgi:hypothetical protein